MISRICSFAMAACFATCMVGETVAYSWSQTIDTTNEYQPGTYTTLLKENFTAPTDWVPGQDTNKDVWVNNEGTVPVFAKIELSQSWVRTDDIYDLSGQPIAPYAGESLPLTYPSGDEQAYAALIQWGEDVVMLAQSESTLPTGLALDIPTVDSLEEATGKWLLLEEREDGNLVFYYMGVIDPGEQSPWLVDGVEMNPTIQAAIPIVHTTWEKDEGGWVTTTTYTENPHNYENAEYTLRVAMTTVQATSDAVLEHFGSELLSEQTIIAQLSAMGTTGVYSRDDTVTEKKLYLSQSTGKLTYIPSTPEENWFMSYLNMMPGERYTDTLHIENQTGVSQTLYMQAIVKGEQAVEAEELLDYITLTVTYNGEVIYEGSGAGVDVDNTLFQVIPLGNYGPGATNQIDITVALDKDLPMEYAGVLATTDWQFMVLQKPSGGPDPTPTPTPTPTPPQEPTPTPTIDIPDGDVPESDLPTPTPDLDIPDEEVPLDEMPQTGDTSSLPRYLTVMLISGIGFAISVGKIKESYRKEQE